MFTKTKILLLCFPPGHGVIKVMLYKPKYVRHRSIMKGKLVGIAQQLFDTTDSAVEKC